MPKQVAVGVVTSDKGTKTRRVELPRLVKHPRYKKYVRRRTVCYVHDENNESKTGDTVEIIECRPHSKTKRWRLVKVVSESSQVDVAVMPAEVEMDAAGSARAHSRDSTEISEPTQSNPSRLDESPQLDEGETARQVDDE